MKDLSYNKISKLFTCIFLFYILWFKYAYREIPIVLYGTAAMATFAMLLDVFMSRSDILEICPYGVLVNIIMCFYSVLTGIWGAKNSSALLSSVETYLAFSMICAVICYISKEERNIDWLTNIIIIICIIVI